MRQEEFPDAGTTGYQRVLGGILFPAIILLVVKWRSAHAHGGVLKKNPAHLAGKMGAHLAVGVGQRSGRPDAWHELLPVGDRKKRRRPSLPAITVALTPVILLPMTRIVDGEKIGVRSLLGALIAVTKGDRVDDLALKLFPEMRNLHR